MIRAVFFDYDGVITKGVADGSPSLRLSKKLGVPVEDANRWIVGVWDGICTGKITESDAWHTIEQQYGKPITQAQRAIWYKWEELTPLPEMLELVQTLKNRGYPVVVVSNVMPSTAQIIRDHGGYDLFDAVVLSCEVGARKPASIIFETALAQLNGIQPDEVLYLDDREPLVTAAQAMGIQSFLVKDHAAAIADVLHLLE